MGKNANRILKAQLRKPNIHAHHIQYKYIQIVRIQVEFGNIYLLQIQANARCMGSTGLRIRGGYRVLAPLPPELKQKKWETFFLFVAVL